MVRASIQRSRYSAERYDRKFLPETSAPCLTGLELSSYRTRQILDRESALLESSSLERVPVLSNHSAPHYGRLWEHLYHFQPIHYTVALELLYVCLPKWTPTTDRQSKNPDHQGSP